MFENLKRFSFRYLKCHNVTKPLDHGNGSYPLFFTPVVHFTVATFDLVHIENIRKMSTKNLKSKTSEKPPENLWFLVVEHIRNMSTSARFSKTF